MKIEQYGITWSSWIKNGIYGNEMLDCLEEAWNEVLKSEQRISKEDLQEFRTKLEEVNKNMVRLVLIGRLKK